MKRLLFLLVLVYPLLMSAQTEITKFPLQDSTKTIGSSIILGASSGDFLFFFQEDDSLFFSRSSDEGETWFDKNFVNNIKKRENAYRLFDGIGIMNGNLILVYKQPESEEYSVILSSDDGKSWNTKFNFSRNDMRDLSFSQINDSIIWLITDVGFYESTDYGQTWSGVHSYAGHISSAVSNVNDTTLLKVLTVTTSTQATTKTDLYGAISHTNGIIWKNWYAIRNTELYEFNPELINRNGTIYLIYSTSSSRYTYEDNPVTIEYVTSNNGTNWSEPTTISSYLGYNGMQNSTQVNNDIYVTFLSDRFFNKQIWYGILGESEDKITPAYIENIDPPLNPLAEMPLKITAKVIDEQRWYLDVTIDYGLVNQDFQNIQMYDDGLHADLNSRDGIFGIKLGEYRENDTLLYKIIAKDEQGYIVRSDIDTIMFNNKNVAEKYLLDVNNFKLPLDNKGILGDVKVVFPDNTLDDGGRYFGKVVLFSGGFALSGYNDDGELWANGVLTALRVKDYLPGAIEDRAENLPPMLYIVEKDDPPFSDSWVKWKDAVALGAYFYDGDNDGYDNDFGSNPPCFLTRYLQGPIDVSNTPQIMAYNMKGGVGIDSLVGFEHLELTSLVTIMKSLGFDDPDDEFQMRYFLQGQNQSGGYLDPCGSYLGDVFNIQCDDVDEKYHFSGDPTIPYGWIHVNPRDAKIMSNSGPFKLEAGKPIDIIVAYIVGQGEDALSSITVAKEYAKQIQSFYESNFTSYVVGTEENNEANIPTEFRLFQNYPNPFNPSTTIKYIIPNNFIPSSLPASGVMALT